MIHAVLYNGLEVPMLGIGTYSLGEEQIGNAIQCGYQLIDTAAQYENEDAVGTAIRKSGISRNDFCISTKLWIDDMKSNNTRNAFFESLKRLKLDYVDIYLIHWPAAGICEAWHEIEKLYNEGYIKAIGVSNFHKKHFDKLFKTCIIKPMVNQVELHPRFHNRELTDYCKEKGMAVEAWSPFGGTGRLLNNDILQQIAFKHQKTAAQITLRWHMQKGIITFPRSGNMDRLKSNMDIFNFELDEKDMGLIDSIDTHKCLGADPELIDV